MNRIKLYKLRNFAAVVLLSLGLASCSQEEPAGHGETLPDGKYPLSLTATVASPQSRAGGKDYWDGGEKIAVNIGDYTGTYIIQANGNTTSDTPYYWQNTTPATVSAWFPYAEGEQTYDISDQSDGYAGFDFLYAQNEGSYAASVQLSFHHQIAKVSYTLVKGSGITDAELATAKVILMGKKSVTVCDGMIMSTSQTGEITPCHDAAALSGSAIMVPQNVTGEPLIKVSIGDNLFLYTPETEAVGNLLPAHHYSYTITVKAHGIEVSAATGGEWVTGGSEDVASKELKQSYSASDLKPGDYYYSDGTWSDGGLRKLYADGSTTQEAVQPNGKTVIGIVFYAGHHPNDQSDYSSTGINSEKCHGYAVALTDATSSECIWGVYGTELGCYPTTADGNKQNNLDNPDIDWCGYDWTQKIITAAGGKDKLNATEQAGYPATWYAIVSYETGCNAPAKSSGWFLPSIGQLWKIYQNRSSLFDSVSEAEGLKSEWYWSSSESYRFPTYCALYLNVGRDVSDAIKYSRSCYVRPILAF